MDEVLYMIKGNNFYYYYYDGLGSVRAITDSSGNTVETYTYDVYGKPTIYNASGVQIGNSQISNPYYFTGREFDFSSGLYYYRNRYYNPELGRFMTPDPAGPVDGPNLYTYVNNNPVNLIDPLGLCWGKERVLMYYLEIHIYSLGLDSEVYDWGAVRLREVYGYVPVSTKEVDRVFIGGTVESYYWGIVWTRENWWEIRYE